MLINITKMKVLYSDLKKFIPTLSATPKKVGEALTVTGFMMDGLEEVKFQGKKDWVMSLEVRHNRADGLSVFGIAQETAAYFGLKTKFPVAKKTKISAKSQMIEVLDKKFTKRVLAYEIDGVKNEKSPAWLSEYLALYGMNSKSLLVDLSNYVMLLTGFPSHLLDKQKIEGKLAWDLNKKFEEITTLDGSVIKLTKDQEIILRDDKSILALAGIVGGKKAEIDDKTEAIICEMGIYDPGTVRKNGSSLGVVTEAGTRLSRYLGPNGLEPAMMLLLNLIARNSSNKKLVFRKFDFYPRKYKAPWIEVDLSKPSLYAGVSISQERSLEILKNLNFLVKQSKKGVWVSPPEERMDVQIEEDVIEEVIRVFGFDKIPSDITPPLEVAENITPKTLILAEKIRDILCATGFDEILSPPLAKRGLSQKCNHLSWSLIQAENPVNEEYCEMRQSMAVGLISQLEEYLKQNLEFINVFEIGKIFGKVGSNFKEHDSLGMLTYGENSINFLKGKTENLLLGLGLREVSYRESKRKPQVANPFVCFDVISAGKNIGIIYKMTPAEFKKNVYFLEVNLPEIVKILEKNSKPSTTEITTKNLILDANLLLKKNETPYEKIRQIKSKIGSKNFFSLEIVDIFPVKDKLRYTFRVTYQGLSDPDAKKLHLGVFGLK